MLHLWENSNFSNFSNQIFKTMQTEKDKYIFGVVKVGDKGQIVIP